jgi:two-component system CheB/CheR fusion protein
VEHTQVAHVPGRNSPRNSLFDDFEVTHDFENIGRRTMLLNARQLNTEQDSPKRILLVIDDITERQQADVERKQLLAREQAARAE